MSPISRRDKEPLKKGKNDAPVSDHRTPLRLFRSTFKANKTPMTVIMGVILLSTVAYLAQKGQGVATRDDVVARVYGRDILGKDVEQKLAEMERSMGNQANLKSLLPYLQTQALQRTINLKLLEELADRHGVVVTDQEVRTSLETQLRQNENFLDKDGKLLPTNEISDILRERGILLIQLENEVRDQLLVQKLMNQASVQIPVDETWVNLENRIQNEKITYEFAALSPDTAAIADPNDATLDAFLKTSGALFQYGPRRVLQYVALDQASFKDSIQVDDNALKAAYESKKTQYTELNASHILFLAKTEAEYAAATKKAEELRAKLAAGGDFGKAAEDFSEDPSAKGSKGNLGWFKLGSMVKPFEDAELALKPGEISQPVRTQFGIHLIKLEGRREKSFDEVKEELRTQMMKDRFAAKAKDQLEKLRKRAGDKGNLSTAASNLGLKIQTSIPLLNEPGATVEGIAESAPIVSSAFKMQVQEISKVTQAGDKFVVFQVKEEKPITIPPLAEIRGKVLAEWKLEEARKKAFEKAKTALDAKDLSKLAAPTTKENATIASLGSLGQHPSIRKALLETAVDGFTPVLWTPEGQVWVAHIKTRTPAEALTFEKRTALVQSIQSSASQDLLEAERRELDTKGRQRSGFSSLWGRFGGIWTNPNSPFGNQEPVDRSE
jgi:peptidyl-prolyl cis-trans isomerase D